MSTSVVKGGLEEVLLQVIGGGKLGDPYAMMSGKLVDLCSTLSSCGITNGCAVYMHYRTAWRVL